MNTLFQRMRFANCDRYGYPDGTFRWGPWTPTNPWYGTWSCSLQPSHLTTFSEDLNPRSLIL